MAAFVKATLSAGECILQHIEMLIEEPAWLQPLDFALVHVASRTVYTSVDAAARALAAHLAAAAR